MYKNIGNDFECCSSWGFLSRIWFLVLMLSEFFPLLHMCLLLRVETKSLLEYGYLEYFLNIEY